MPSNAPNQPDTTPAPELAGAIRRMGDPSWLVLHCLGLSSEEPLAAFEIIALAEGLLRSARYPVRDLSPSTVSRALGRLKHLKLVRAESWRASYPRGPQDPPRPDNSRVFALTDLGGDVLAHRRRLDAVLAVAVPLLSPAPAEPLQSAAADAPAAAAGAPPVPPSPTRPSLVATGDFSRVWAAWVRKMGAPLDSDGASSSDSPTTASTARRRATR